MLKIGGKSISRRLRRQTSEDSLISEIQLHLRETGCTTNQQNAETVLIATALEELKHFQQAYRIMQKRGLQFAHEIGEDI